MNTNTGLHATFDLADCRCEMNLLKFTSSLRPRIAGLIALSGLNIVGVAFHEFEGGGLTGAFLLAESHLTLHTWPDNGVVSFDIYASNHEKDNSESVKILARSLLELFMPSYTLTREFMRGKPFFIDALGNDTCLLVEANASCFSTKSNYQNIEVYDTNAFGKILRLDGRIQLSEADEFIYHEALVHPALVSHDQPSSVLIIGGADGGAAEEVLKHPSVRLVKLVDIDQEVVDVCKTFFAGIQKSVFDDPRVTLVCDDAWHYVSTECLKFDIILLDLPEPSGTATRLYSEEFFWMCSRLLEPVGYLVLHTGSPVTRPDQVSCIAGDAAQVFANIRPYLVYVPVFAEVLGLMMCSNDSNRQRMSADEIDMRLDTRGILSLELYDGACHQAMFTIPKYLRRAFCQP